MKTGKMILSALALAMLSQNPPIANAESTPAASEAVEASKIHVESLQDSKIFKVKEITVKGYVTADVKELTIDGEKAVLTWNDSTERYHFDTKAAYEKDGVYNIVFNMMDGDGAVTSHTETVLVDTTPPKITGLEYPKSVKSSYEDSSAPVKFQATDNFGELYLKIDNEDYGSFKNQNPYEAVSHTFEPSVGFKWPGMNESMISISDIAGNTASVMPVIYWQPVSYVELPNQEFPLSHNEVRARLIVKEKIVPLLKGDPKTGEMEKVRDIKPGEALRVYGTYNHYYNVGGDYYVENLWPGTTVLAPYIGRIIIDKDTPLYSPSHKVHRMLKKGEAIRVYSHDFEKYDVGNGYHVYKKEAVKYYVGQVTLLKNVTMYTPSGKVYKTLPKGKKYRVYNVEGNKFDLGGGYCVAIDKTAVKYGKN